MNEVKKRLFIFGLGNYDNNNQFLNTRHNVGFEAIDKINYYYRLSNIRKNKYYSTLYSEIVVNLKKIDLYSIKLHCLMNYSGEIIKKVKKDFQLENNEILIIYDDIYTSLSSIKFRKSGTDGGHNGMKDIIKKLDIGGKIMRIKIGVGENPTKEDLGEWLTNPNKFSSNDRNIIENVINNIPKVIEIIINNEGNNNFSLHFTNK